MDNIYVIRGRIEELYGKHSKLFDKAFQFILAMITFSMINQNTGFMKSLSSPVISLALAVVATFLPPMVIVVIAAVLVLAHTLAASIGIFAVSAMIFLIMYIFYIRLAPKMAFVVLLTPIAFVLKIPFLVPIVCALIYTPVSLVPMSCGTVVFYMVEYLKKTSSASKASGSKAMLSEITTYVQKVFQNKEMWIYIVAFIIGFFVVYTIRRRELDHAWKIGIIAGAIADVVVTAMGSIALGVEISYGSLIFGNILAVIVGMILELFLFSVDYARSERLQFEDDEYYYYVKAVPKMTVAAPTNTVKKINTQRRPANQTAHPAGQGRPSGQSRSGGQNVRSAEGSARSVVTERTAPARSSAPYGQQNPYRGREMTGGRSVTISSDHMAQDDSDDYEELF